MVKLYICRADVSGAEYEKLMTADRIEKYRRLKTETARRQCVAAARLLRRAFPDAVRFDVSPSGRLSLPGSEHFSLSHSGGYAVLAVAALPVGVDIERIRPLDHRKIAARVFDEGRRIRLAEDSSPERFFRLWTEYESYFKRSGKAPSAADSETGFLCPPAPEGYVITVCTGETDLTVEYVG